MKKANYNYIFPLVLIYFEVLLRIYTKTGILLNLIYPILFGIGTGLLCSVFVSFFSGKSKPIAVLVLLTLIGIIFIIECFVYRSMQFYMPLTTIGTMAGSVTGSYGDQVMQTILYGIPIIISFLLPAILYLCRLYKDLKTFGNITDTFVRREMPSVHLVLGAVCFLCIGIIWAICGTSSDKYKNNYQFNTAVETFGLVSGIQLDLYYSIFPNQTADELIIMNTDEIIGEERAESPDENGSFLEIDSGSSTITRTPEIVYNKNEMQLDWDKISSVSNNSVKELNEYVQSIPASIQNAYTGLFQGKNLILICAEAFSHAVIDRSLTPTLYRLTHNGFYFSNYYQPSWNGSTSTGEYSMLMGIAPLKDVRTMPATQGNNLYFTMGNQLQRLGYSGNAYHNGSYKYYSRHLTHENLGYDDWIAQGNGLEKLSGAWPSDLEMFEGTLPTYIDKQPFSVYYMTVSGHFPYKADDEKTREHLEYVQQKTGDKYDDKTQYYLAYQMELEYSLRYVVRQLEAKGIADDTVICITADHYPYGLEHSSTYGNKRDYIEDLYGYYPQKDWERDKNAWILWSGCLENENKDMACEISEPTYSLDILPTLSNLFGLEYDSRMLVGRDVFSYAEPLVLWTNHSWVTDKGKYDAKTGNFYPEEGIHVEDSYIERIKNEVSNKLLFSGKILDYDYYHVVFDE